MLTIAIDGPAAAGKSSIAKEIARQLSILYIDTGAMYRAVALKAISSGISIYDEEGVVQAMKSARIEIAFDKEGIQRIFLDGEDVSDQIRTEEISMAASKVSSYKQVRTQLVALQREIASGKPVVMDGRDIGTAVLPGATHKFFVTASPQTRAQRRFDELMRKGLLGDNTYDQLLCETIKRDYDDSHREHSPLMQANDAQLIDTTHYSLDEVVSIILKKIQSLS